jgi:folate-binding protein YgfZ
MSPELFQQIKEEGGWVDLSARAKFRLTGGDRVRYLNGQVTNDVRPAGPRATIYACVTDLKGKIVGDVFVHAEDDSLVLDAEAELREVLAPRLERYIIADDVELADVTDEWQLWHAFGAAADSLVPGVWSAAEGARILASTRLGRPGFDVWVPAGAAMPEHVGPVLSAEDFETYRILHGVPRYPNELNAEAFPPEAGLDESAMSYTKGCYIGQEILSRIRTTGKMPRTLIQWRSETEITPRTPWMVDGKPVGSVTSVAQHPVDGGFVCLGYVRQGTDVGML